MDQHRQRTAERKRRTATILIVLTCFLAALMLSGCSEKKSGTGGWREAAEALSAANDWEEALMDVEVKTDDGMYAYSLLDTHEKKIYNVILSALDERHTGKLPPDTTKEVIEKVYLSVMADNPELFYVSGYEIRMLAQPAAEAKTEETGTQPLEFVISFEGKEELSADETAQRKERLETLRREVLEGIAEDAGDYEKAKQVYDYVILHTIYGGNAGSGQTADAALLEGKAVCTGYARAAQYLLQGAGIDSTLIKGRKGGRPHAWLLVRLDGDYYYMDPTEGDNLLANMPSNYRRIFVNYAYFAMTTADLGTKYTDDGHLPLPECTAQADSYFEREGRFIGTAAEAELEEIRQLPDWTAAEGIAYLQFRSEKGCYEEATAGLTEGGPAAANGWICMKGDEFCLLTFYRPVGK